MRHARADYNRFQDPTGKIPAEEPVFLLRGQDACAPDTLLDYANRVERNGGDPEVVRRTREWAYEMRQWQAVRGNKMPDVA